MTLRSLALLAATLLLAPPVVAEPPSVEDALRARLAQGTITLGEIGVRLSPETARFYERFGPAPVWNGREAALPGLIEDAANDGLNPEDYHLRLLAARLATPASGALEVADRDVLATDTFLRLSEHLLRGRVDPHALFGDDWIPTRRERDLPALLAEGLASGDLAAALDAVRPPHPEYAALRRALARQREIAGAELPPILPARPVAEGDADPRVPLIRDRLRLIGDYEGGDASGERLDAPLAAAVRRFQERHRLAPTGVVDNQTRRLLNQAPDDHTRRLALNLERWRWLPDDFGDTHLVVNIPAYELMARENGETVMTMRAVVGRARNRTPVLSDTLRSITFAPTWAVPRSLVAGEIMPAARREGADFLERRGFTVYHGDRVVRAQDVDWPSAPAGAYGFIQAPGPTNPMGQVKFNLGNPFNIFLHDTNQPRLLEAASRDASAGCVRLERAVDLAAWMLRHWSNWQRDDVERHASGRRPEYVAPRDRWDVHLVYFTAWPDTDGGIAFFDDVYGHDARLAHAH